MGAVDMEETDTRLPYEYSEYERQRISGNHFRSPRKSNYGFK